MIILSVCSISGTDTRPIALPRSSSDKIGFLNVVTKFNYNKHTNFKSQWISPETWINCGRCNVKGKHSEWHEIT
jgi:hypothetical protein